MSGEVLPSFQANDDVVSANIAGVSLSVDKKTAVGVWGVVRSWPAVVWLCLLGMLYSGLVIWYLAGVAFPQHIQQVMAPIEQQTAELKGVAESLGAVASEIKSERLEHAKERSENNARIDRFMEKLFDSRSSVPLPNRDSTIGAGT